MTTPTATLVETLFVRADRLCLGDTVFLTSSEEERGTVVSSLELVGDDVVVSTFGSRSFETSQGNVLRVRRQVRVTDPNRYVA